METVKDRLKHFIKTLGMSVNAFEKKWGTGQSYVNNISKGIGNEHLTNLCNLYPELNLNWLFTGKGSMLLPESENLSENKSNLAKQKEKTPRLITHQNIQKLLTKQKEEFMSELSETFGKFTDTLNKQIETNNKQIEANNNLIERSFTLMMEQMKLMHSMIGRVEEKTNRVIDMNRKAM